MPVPTSQRNPKFKDAPPERTPKLGGNPEKFDSETVAWHFHRLDRPHESWGWDKLKARQWKELLVQLVALEGLTWAELKLQAGGKAEGNGTNHHPIPRDKFSSEAQKRLTEIHLDDFDSLFSLRLNGTLRIYGVRDGRVLQMVWHDPHHGSGNGACPTKKQKKKSQKK